MSAPAPACEGRGSLQRELDEQIDRQTRLMELEAASGRPVDVREQSDGRRFWFVPAALVASVGSLCAVVL